jgi:hypothetical protein
VERIEMERQTKTTKARRMRCKARRAVILGFGLFVLAQVGLLAVIEGLKPILVDAEFGIRLDSMRSLVRQYPGRESLAVLGSSRMGNGFETDYAMARSFIEDRRDSPIVVNMSMTGGTSVWQYLALRRLIDNGLKPDAVIVEILPMTLVSDAQYFRSDYHFPPHRLRWRDVLALSDVMPDQSNRHLLEWIINNVVFPWHTHRFPIVDLLLPAWQVDQLNNQSRPRVWRHIISPTGWIPFSVEVPTPEQRHEAEEVARKAYGELGDATELCQSTCRLYQALFACCRENGIKISAVVMMPESEGFRGLYGRHLLEHVGRFAASISREERIPVVDAREWIPADRFWDGHHLLTSGARMFTDRMCTEVLGFKRTATGRHVASGASSTVE